ncbi:methyltransferase domain-containing protein [Candidatus Latescibacterota bacterium]
MDQRTRRPPRRGRPPVDSRPSPEPGAGLFARLIGDGLSPDETAEARAVEPLAHLEYRRELALKNQALASFWVQHKLAGEPAPVLPSPRPRHYRTTTRRRARYHAGRLQLGFGDQREPTPAVPDSALEPDAHSTLYRYLAEELSAPPHRPVAQHLNHAIIRGSYETYSVILNLDELSAPIVRRLKVLAGRLQERPEPVISAFAFCDPSRSEYYFEREAPPVPVRLKKLFGPARFPLPLAGRRYALPPTSFSQVNESMVEPMLAAVRQLLQPRAGDGLLDLYCGYGLFSHDLSDTCTEVVGLDVDRGSIQSARDQLRFSHPAGRVTFSCGDISPESLDRSLPQLPDHGRELVVLDPPRQGTAPGVVSHLAARRPHAVVHVFCGIESIPAAAAEWKSGGYAIVSCTPLDMFPGTPNLETLILLHPRGR